MSLAVTLGPSRVASVGGHFLLKHRHPPGDSDPPWYALAHSSSPSCAFKVWGLFFSLMLLCVVSCLFISWAKQHWEMWTRDPLLKNQWWKTLSSLWSSWWYKWELKERMLFRLNLCCQRCWRYRPWTGQRVSFLAFILDDWLRHLEKWALLDGGMTRW